MLSLSQLLETLLPSMPENLIDKSSKKQFLRCDNLFPKEIQLLCTIFECPLSGTECWGDISLYTKLPSPHFGSLEQTLYTNEWKELISFIEEGQQRELFNERMIKGIWIELDTGSSTIWPPLPNFFLHTDFSNDQGQFLIKSHEEILPRFKRKKLSEKTLQLCITPTFFISQIGIMPGRSLERVRVCTSHQGPFSKSQWESYLRSLDFPDSIISLIDKMTPSLQKIIVQVDSGENLAPRGVDCIVEGNNPESRNKQWELLLDHLRKKGIVKKEKQDSLLCWSGNEYLLSKEGDMNPFLIRKEISHIKLVLQSTKVTAKAYLLSKIIPLSWP
jgi:hypothetical protein